MHSAVLFEKISPFQFCSFMDILGGAVLIFVSVFLLWCLIRLVQIKIPLKILSKRDTSEHSLSHLEKAVFIFFDFWSRLVTRRVSYLLSILWTHKDLDDVWESGRANFCLDRNQYFERMSDFLSSKNTSQLLLVVGPWGSGKTHFRHIFTSALIHERSKSISRYSGEKYINKVVNLIGIKSVESLLRVVESRAHPVIYFSLFLLTIDFVVSFADRVQVPSLFGIIAIFFLFLNTTFQSFLSVLIRYFGATVQKILGVRELLWIEDLDRSALSEAECFQALALIPRINRKIIVNFGANSLDDEVDIAEKAQKLRAELMILGGQYSRKISFLKFSATNAGFSSIVLESSKNVEWLDQVNYRSIEQIYKLLRKRRKDLSDLDPLFIQIFEIYELVKSATSKFVIPKKISDIVMIKESSKSVNFTLPEKFQTEENRTLRHILYSLAESINGPCLWREFELHITVSGSSSNSKEVEFTNFIRALFTLLEQASDNDYFSVSLDQLKKDHGVI